ncbi:hypothetical protein [Flavobacterium cheongpyeongense]|uniref:hypothetical protein n=1 Tax=Flavobacterium cheongpyeongense TaxID=2212651 RepID=UPI000F4DDC16|nr:hypothetical protein [Flavobacterium cheongpyeongense]
MKNFKLFYLFLLVTVSLHAQPPFPGDVDDVEPPAPIDGWVIPSIILGSILGYRIIKRNHKNDCIT